MFQRLRKSLFLVTVVAVILAISAAAFASTKPLVLTGKDLTIEDIVSVAVEGRKVTVSQEAMKNVEKSYNTVIKAAVEGMPVYGLTVGVGWNKELMERKSSLKNSSTCPESSTSCPLGHTALE